MRAKRLGLVVWRRGGEQPDRNTGRALAQVDHGLVATRGIEAENCRHFGVALANESQDAANGAGHEQRMISLPRGQDAQAYHRLDKIGCTWAICCKMSAL